ncbi:glycosyl transferase family 1, partial [Acinetobacter baumannii]
HCQPLNRLRSKHKLAPLGYNLRRIYADADHLLIPDLAGLYPLGESNGSYSYIGPLLWSPDTPQPSWWQDPDNEPMGTV